MTRRNGKNFDANTIAELMRFWYVSNRETDDNRNQFYCGITNDPETRKDTHEREDHDGREIVKMLVYECENVDIAIDTESIMGEKGFDIGTPRYPGNGADDDSKYVYLYRKP